MVNFAAVPAWLEIANTIASTLSYAAAALGIVIGGIWFFISRRNRYVLQMSLVLRGIATHHNKQAPIIRIIFNNVGNTAVERGACKAVAWDYNVSEEPSETDIAKELDVCLPRTHVEPGDEIFEDVVLHFDHIPDLYAVRVRFSPPDRPAGAWQWETTALFYKNQQPEMKISPDGATALSAATP